MTTVSLTGVTKSFGDTAVLRGVDLTVPDASLTAVLGRSGSGKTTLLRVLAGFERPDSGVITVDDEVLVGEGHFVPAQRRRIGYVFQEGVLFPHLSVADNIGFGLKKGPDRTPRIAAVLALVGLAGRASSRPHELSGGQQQRVALGRALAPEPRLLLLDEPFSSLDAKMRSDLRAEVIDVLRTTKTTTILVTHDQDEALSIADQVAVLRHGAVSQVGTPRDIYESPKGPGVATFIGVANLVDGVYRNGVVESPLGRLHVRSNEALREGAPTLALIRPEELELSIGDAGEGIAVVVQQVEYYGHDALVHVQVDSASEGAVRAVTHKELPGGAEEHEQLAALVIRSYGATDVAVGSFGKVRCVTPVLAWQR